MSVQFKLTLGLIILGVCITFATGDTKISSSYKRRLGSKSSKSKKSKGSKSSRSRAGKSKTYVADLDQYGSFTMTVYDDDTMDYVADLKTVDNLYTQGAVRMYHLHSGFVGGDAGFAVGAETGADFCGSTYTLGHYDPFSACGGASTAKSDPPVGTSCTPNTDDYCTNKSDNVLEVGQDEGACEVGDLNGRFGALPNASTFTLAVYGVDCPGCYKDYVARGNVKPSYKTWGSIVFHNDGPRVLCGDLIEV